jgi:hypothetical protein
MKRLFGFILPVVGVCMMVSCTSLPYEVAQKGDPAVLGQKTVFLDAVLLPRSLAVLPLIDAGIYNAAVAGAEKSFKQVEETKMRLMRDTIADAYERQYGGELIRAAYPVEQDKISFNYFSEASEETVAKLVALCEENEAETIVAVVGQIVCTGVGTFGIQGVNQMRISLCVFDKKGQLLAQGNVNAPGQKAGPSDAVSYGFLFDEGSAYCVSMLQDLAVSQ